MPKPTRKIIWIGGPKGTGKSTVLRKSGLKGTVPIIHTGRLIPYFLGEKNRGKLPGEISQREVNDATVKVIRVIKNALRRSNAILIDGHFSFRGHATWSPEMIEKLSRIPRTEFLLINLTASKREILQRILSDISRDRSQDIRHVRDDILLNRKFYEEYVSLLSTKKPTRAHIIWNKNIEEASKVLRDAVGDFLSERWKRSFMVKL